jgi:hypothetical protein
MDTLEALKAEIETATEPVLKQVYDFVVFLKARLPASHAPDFDSQQRANAARRREIFGGVEIPNSEAMDAMHQE